MEKFKVAIIGCGGIANGKHLPSLKNLENVELIAFCDIVRERAERAAAEYGVPGAKVYEDYKELLASEHPEVVHICTPNRSHSFITVDALEAGCHVMCEKPMAINAEEAKKMLDAAKRTGKKLTIGYQNRQTAAAQFLKAESDKGTFGKIYFAKAHALRRRAVPTWGVFMNEYEQGGGPLVDIGTHALDMTLWIMNNYSPKFCVGTKYRELADNLSEGTGNAWGDWDPKQYTVEDSCFGFVVMENGATIFLESSWALNALDTIEASTTLCGSLAGADMREGCRINGVKNGRPYVLKPDLKAGGVAFYEGISQKPKDIEAYQWYKSLSDGTEPCVTPEQAYIVSLILDGIYKSAKSGEPYYFNK